jgi:cytochrome b
MKATVKVWDPLVRIFHWSLAASFVVAWLSADTVKDLHEWAGYVAGALVAFRLVLGLAGSPYARFRQFVRRPSETLSYAKGVVTNRERRYIGHNPLGALMVVALLASMSALVITGWLQTADAFWGVEWVEDLHEAVANILLLLVALHVGGVAFSSFRHGENLVRAMVTGRKRAAEQGDVS